MQDEGQRLRAAVQGLARHRTLRRYPPKLRERVTAHARRRLAEGASLSSVVRELDVSEPTLSRFLAREEAGFAALSVVNDAQVAAPERDRRLTLRGPCGVVVEGLAVDEVARLVWMLACLG